MKENYANYLKAIQAFDNFEVDPKNKNDTISCAVKWANFYSMPTSTESEVAKKAQELLDSKTCFASKGMPIENILCPEMYMLSSENKFVFFRTWEDEKNYDKTFDDGFFF